MVASKFKIIGVEKVRQDTYKVFVDAGREGQIRIVVYPPPLPMQVFGWGDIQWLEADLSASQRKKVRAMVDREIKRESLR